MANREQLITIRAARAGVASAQLELGKQYLFGTGGLPKSLATALHWLDRAARQQVSDAWLLIGSYIPFEIALHSVDSSRLFDWYEKAFDAGVVQAGVVLAKLVKARGDHVPGDAIRRKAGHALQSAAEAGNPDAQWLLAQESAAVTASGRVEPAPAERKPVLSTAEVSTLEWVERAAHGGVGPARKALADHFWAKSDYAAFLGWALPMARQLVRHHEASQPPDRPARPMSPEDARFISRCADVLLHAAHGDAVEIQLFLECAAQAGDRQAQLSLGLWLARMERNGGRMHGMPDTANYKGAIRWLISAGRQGAAEAWHAMSRIYLNPAFSQRNLVEARRYLEMAAQAGHGAAQLELGMTAWRTRREDPDRDVHAIYWLQQAAAKGIAEADALLKKIVAPAQSSPWAEQALRRVREGAGASPYMTARLELAAMFGLSRAEALLIDVNQADRGHCLVVDIRARYARSRRRLVLLRTAGQRQGLTRIVALFKTIDCSPDGPEGNYRQRLYRLKGLIGEPDAS